MTNVNVLLENIREHFHDVIESCTLDVNQVTLEVPATQLRQICFALRDEKPYQFNMLMDISGVDYLTYGMDEWEKEETTTTGFSRGVIPLGQSYFKWQKPRFAAVYHLLSLPLNQRLRLRIFAEGEPPMIDSVIDIWNSANWYEREAFDLYGILFKGHPDLRRLLTDYGFIGHPFRKDFPLIGNVEMRYDATLQRCVYDPVSIRPRTLVPKVIRKDSRYLPDEEEEINV